VIEGTAAPESANNPATQGVFIPLLAPGIPSNVVMVMLLSAKVLYPSLTRIIILFCITGVYTTSSSIADVLFVLV